MSRLNLVFFQPATGLEIMTELRPSLTERVSKTEFPQRIVQRPVVSVCVCSSGRSQLLEQLLTSLAHQTYLHHRFEIVVVDTATAGLVTQVVQRAAALHSSIVFRYATEETGGMARARNKAVAIATGKWLAFLDEAQEIRPSWLEDMLATALATDAAAVLGPKVCIYPPGAPPWLVESRFFDKRRFETAERVSSDYGRTSNALIAATWLNARPEHAFNPQLDRSGFEDHDFFLWLEKKGGHIVWCDDAVATEVLPRSRHSLIYILSRTLRSSSAYWRNVNRYRPAWQAWKEALMGLAGAMVFALAGLLAGVAGKHAAVPFWVKSVKGIGRALAVTNIKLARY